MLDIVRESTLGQALNTFFGILPYEDQRPEYVVPSRYLPSNSSPGFSSYPTMVDEKAVISKPPSVHPVSSARSSSSDLNTLAEESRRQSTSDAFVAAKLYPERGDQNDHVENGLKKEEPYNLDVTPGPGELQPPIEHPEYVIVGWHGDDDPENPRNWSLFKRGFVAGQIMLLTFAVCEYSAFV